MQQSIYQSKFQEMFPEFEPIIQGDALAILNLASNTGLQERYVAKSDKLIELEKEKALAWQLKEKSDLLWNKISQNAINHGEYRYKNAAQDPNLPHICCQPLDYSKYREDGIWWLMSAIAEQKEELNAYPRYWEFARRISCNVDAIFENISVALEQESKGTTGEDVVVEYIKRVSTSRMLQSVVLPAASGNEAKTAESDLLIVTANGVYVCEIKNYGKAGQTIQIDQDGIFRKLNSKGDCLKEYASPFEQNDYHCRAIRRILQDNGMSHVPVHSVVVVSNTDVNVQNYSGMLVVDQYQLGELIRSAEQTEVLSSSQIGAVYKAIQEKRIEERSFPIMGISGAVYDMYEFCLGALLHYVEQNDQWANDCSKRLTEWAEACNKFWLEMNQETVMAEDAEKQKRRRVKIAVCCVVAAMIIALICIFWEQFLTLLSIVVTLAFFAFLFKLFFGN